ncbi:MAG: FAD binding domain-containing protein [Deferrisomatales bacterium]
MRLASFEHLEPMTVAEACALLAEHGETAAVMAGGTDLLVRMKHGVTTPGRLVNIKRVEGLGAIRRAGEGLSLGAAATLTEVRTSPLVQGAYPVLAEAALGVGAAQLQNMGTLGGNLCLEPRCWYYQQTPSWRAARQPCLKNQGAVCYMAKGAKRCYALYCGDTAAALLALGASVRLVSAQGERTLVLEDFFVDDGQHPTVLRRGELLAEVLLPPPAPGQKGTYLKYRKRGTVDFPIVGVAAVVRPGVGVRVAVTGAGSAPFLVAGTEGRPTTGPLTPEGVGELAAAAGRQARPVSRMEVSPSYRKELVRVLTQDALEKLTV